MPLAPRPEDHPRRLQYARAWRLATGVLVALTAVYLGTHLVGDGPVVGLVRAMAEAGMIGGLADWFAVVALFRRPLGLPIPHTGLLPANQARAARNVGRFFEAHFLDPGQLEPRLREAAPALNIADWLAERENARALARQLAGFVGGLLLRDPPPRVRVRVRAWLRAQALSAGADAAIAASVATLVKGAVRGAVVDEVLTLVREAVDANRDTAVALVQDRSRWWIAATVDRRVAGIVVDGVLSLLDELRDEGSPLRRNFEAAFDRAIDDLGERGLLERAVLDARRRLVETGAFDALAARLADTLRSRTAARLEDDIDGVAAPLATILGDLARRLRSDAGRRAELDARLAALVAKVIGQLRPALGGYVANVIAGWRPEELTDRFEVELGPDLQFIRINGALLGALIGGVLYALGAVLG